MGFFKLATIFKVPTRAQLGFLKLDASISENHSRTAQVTKNEVEDGTVVSDHIKLNPETLTITGQISDAPVSILGLGISTDDILGAAKSSLFGDSTDKSTGLFDQFTSQFGSDEASLEELVKRPNRSPEEAWKYLQQLWRNRTPFGVVTGLQKYDSMVISKLSAPRSSKDGSSLMFTATLERVIVVKSSTAKVPAFKVADDSKHSGATKGLLGKQAGKAASDALTDNSSLLLKGFKKVGVF